MINASQTVKDVRSPTRSQIKKIQGQFSKRSQVLCDELERVALLKVKHNSGGAPVERIDSALSNLYFF